jgi:phage-related protein
VLVENKDAIDALNKTDKKAKTTGEKLGGMAATAGKVGAAVVGMGAAAAVGLTKVATDTAAAGDRVDKMSQKIGLSRESFQEWDYVMSQNGMSIDSMQSGMKTLVNSFDDMKKGGATSTEAFERLGLSMSDLEGLSQEEIFEKTVAGLQGVTDESERAALANDLFGRQGSEMAPLLNQSAESIENLKNQAHEMGMVMSDESIGSAASLTDTIDTLKRAGGGLMATLGSALMPVLQQVLDVVVQNMPMIQGLFQQFAPILADVFSKLLPPIMDLISTLLPPLLDIFTQIMSVLGELMTGIMPVIIELIEMLLPPIMEIVQLILPLLLSLIKPLMPLLLPILQILQPFIDILMMIIRPLVQLLDMILPPLINIMAKFFEWYLPKLSKAFSGVADIIGGVFKRTFESLKNTFNTIKNVFTGIISFVKNVFTGNWRGAWDAVKKIFTDIWDGIKNSFKIPINWIIDGFNKFTRGLNRIKIPDWVPGVGGKGINIPEIPKLKVGMDYVPYDDFPALLHKGERVVTAEENKNYSSGIDYDKLGSAVANALQGMSMTVDGRQFGRVARDYV